MSANPINHSDEIAQITVSIGCSTEVVSVEAEPPLLVGFARRKKAHSMQPMPEFICDLEFTKLSEAE